MQQPIVSIVVPVWNAEPYLSRCLRSLATQTLQEIEIIIVNDGSTDSSLPLCRAFADEDRRFKVYSKENEGPGLARNFGFDRARGTYICYVDSDDWLDPSMCAKTVETIEREGADFVSFGLDFVNPSGRVVKTLRMGTCAPLQQPEIFSRALIDDGVLTTPCNKLYRRAPLAEAGVRFPGTRINEDVFYSRAVAYVASKTSFLPDVLYHALIRPDSVSRRMSAAHFCATRDVLHCEREFFARHAGPTLNDELFAAHVVKIFSYLLVQAAFRVSSPLEYDRCFAVAGDCGFGALSRSPAVLARLQKRSYLLALLCRHPHLLRGIARALSYIGVSPY